ncbi:hypothetical protein A3D11_04425 [Candidatus Peribacteria bacterium RIFCSPHIGHO2_02_FULL_49_16]|nr:MAG: hypothetical protein A2880_03990 [Candidatus Peribacteria bacterium RIFCSPHIGHO2_01_FULL_49_38]OGJ58948.1 MAG: hypothetical protein A3D11_04425 [Candidatus Peribacteria bacterium RIFCSPHIGHO2_02_FULL_49_16]
MTEKENNLPDHELVYVDPEQKTIVGPIEWGRNGKLKSFPIPKKETGEETRVRRRKFFPICTVKAAKRIWKISGTIAPRPPMPFDDAMAKALQEPYWD